MLAPLWGDLWCAHALCSPGDGFSWAIVDEIPFANAHTLSNSYNALGNPLSVDQDFFTVTGGFHSFDDTHDQNIASALVRQSAVPEPGAVWLLSAGLLGLLGFKRRNH